MRISAAGDVGIGTSSPADKLNISAGNIGLTGSTSTINFRNGPGSIIQQIQYSDPDGSLNFGGTSGGPYPLKFSTNGTERMRISAAGDVGIGITPTTKLEVSAANAVLASAGIVQIGSTTAGADVGGQITFRNSDARRAAIAGRQEGAGATAGYLQFGTRGSSGDVTERMRLNSTGAVILQGGTTTASGVGIAFPATQSASSDANTLDDYEEGTWTPALQGSSTAGTYTYDTDRTGGTYTKIGNTVLIRGVIRVSGTTSAGSGNAQITGLPFASINPDTSWGRIPSSLAVQSGPTLANSSIFVHTDGNSTTYLGVGIQGTATWTAATVAQVATTDSIWFFQLQYNVS
jgi:hypothetical protein